jgi:hypothetical protein
LAGWWPVESPSIDLLDPCLSLPYAALPVFAQIKLRLSVAVDHFNKDYKKGLHHLQSMKLLPHLTSQRQQETLRQVQQAAAAQQHGQSPVPQPPAPRQQQQEELDEGVEEEQLATYLGQFLRVCPGEVVSAWC